MVFHDDCRRAVLRDLHLAGKLERRRVRSKGADGFSAEFGVGSEPFSNELGYVTLKGSDLKDALEQQWKSDLNSQNSRPMLKLNR